MIPGREQSGLGDEVLALPSSLPLEELSAGLVERGPWFYPYVFSNGVQAPRLDNHVPIHTDRTRVIFSHLGRLFGHRWPSVTALDLACHEGWFSFQAALRGAGSVRGIDVRPEHIGRARWLADVSGLDKVQFTVGDLFSADAEAMGQFDLVFFVGIFYHLENPMGALRMARGLTREVCVLEGQVARPAQIETGWGPVGHERRGPAMAVLLGEPVHAHKPEGVVLVPTLEALRLMLMQAGFRDVHLVMPNEKSYEAFRTYDRVVLFAYI